MTINGAQISVASRSAPQEENPLWAGRLVISAEQPDKHLDWIERKSKSGALPNNQCLYRCIGDTLLLIGDGPDSRPTQFLSGAGKSPKTIVFTRVPK